MKSKLEITHEIKKNNFEGFTTLINEINDYEDFTLIGEDLTYIINPKYSESNPEKLPKSGISILHISAYYNSLQCFQYLQNEKHLSLRHLSQHNLLPLHYALFNGSTDVALYILKEDPEESILHPEESKYLSLLNLAVCGSDKVVVEELFKNGAKLNDPWNDEESIIDKAICRHNNELLSLVWSKHSPLKNDENYKKTYAMRCVINHSFDLLKIIYNKDYDLNKYFIDRSGYHSLIGLIAETDAKHICKDFYLKILDDAKDMSIEPSEECGNCRGVCHWCCLYQDLDVAKKMLKTKNVQINRVNKEKKIGAFHLTDLKRSDNLQVLELLITEGLDINFRFDENCPTLLESFLISFPKNYPAIESLVKHGADIHALHSGLTDRHGNKMTLLQFVNEKSFDSKLKKIFNEL